MSTARDHPDLSGLFTGGVPPDEARRLEAHLAACEPCSREVTSLQELQQLLEDMPPEMLIDGPPDDGDLLLARTLREVRAEATGPAGRNWLLTAAAAACVVGLALGIGVLIGRSGQQSQPAAEASPSRAPTSSATAPPTGVRTASATDARTGARLTVSVTPAPGWIRLTAAVTGVPEGERCELIVVGRDGRRHVAGSWMVSAKGAAEGTTLNGSTLVDVSDAASVLVQNMAGKRFVEAQL
jgi:Putative zinc-finger